jgi:hypothetical protein
MPVGMRKALKDCLNDFLAIFVHDSADARKKCRSEQFGVQRLLLQMIYHCVNSLLARNKPTRPGLPLSLSGTSWRLLH